jgi:cellulose synthase/poly-beta-1,6-N-acetylglucosamine synthase-like glycosyltransferase
MVSILIAARNEELHIGDTINDLLAQNYPRNLIEIIIVDDHSTDRTSEIITSYSAQGVKLIQLKEDKPLNSYKKKAIAEAIHTSTGELIITTDADCRMGNEWLKTIVNFYEEYNFKLISSPVVFYKEKSLFEELQTLEFLYLIGLGASTIGNKRASTCNGANLAYTKDVFLELKGFQGIDDLASGDDELFLHKVAARYADKIGFCKSEAAIVYTYAKHNLKEFIQQRKRWASKSTRYKNKAIVVLGVTVWLFNLSIIVNFIAGLYNPEFFHIALISLACKFLCELFFLLPLTKFIKRRRLVFYLPLVTFIHIFYIVYIGIAGNSGKYNWKGRSVR